MTSTNAPGQPYRMELVPPGEMDDWGRINHCICGPDATGEAPDVRPDCPEHGVLPPLDLSPEGTDLYGTRAISDHGQPVHDRCGQPLRWSVAYDEPHWVHTSAAAVVACPPVRGAL